MALFDSTDWVLHTHPRSASRKVVRGGCDTTSSRLRYDKAMQTMLTQDSNLHLLIMCSIFMDHISYIMLELRGRTMRWDNTQNFDVTNSHPVLINPFMNTYLHRSPWCPSNGAVEKLVNRRSSTETKIHTRTWMTQYIFTQGAFITKVVLREPLSHRNLLYLLIFKTPNVHLLVVL